VSAEAWRLGCPEPGAAIDWAAFQGPWVEAMAGCMQDPLHHGEGDVWTHTRMVCETPRRGG
jgi:hypothetical protein